MISFTSVSLVMIISSYCGNIIIIRFFEVISLFSIIQPLGGSPDTSPAQEIATFTIVFFARIWREGGGKGGAEIVE